MLLNPIGLLKADNAVLMLFCVKMRLLVVFLIITLTNAKRNKLHKGVKKTEGSLVEELISDAAIDDNERYRSVPFGHILRDGFNPNISQPVDFIELDSIYLKESDQIKKLVKNGFKHISPIVKEKPLGFADPKDELYFGEKEKKKEKEKENENEKEKEANLKDKAYERTWHDFVGYQRRNINISPEINKMPNLKDLVVSRQTYNNKLPPSAIAKESKVKYFDSNSFDLAGSRRQSASTVNWTTCDEFRRKADFHPKDVINIDWVPFYVWSENRLKASSTVHRFSYPTRKLVKEYKDTFLPYIDRVIDWEQPKLVLNETVRMLLIAGDRRGLFTVIPHMDIPKHVPAGATVPTYQIRMKKVDPYLALMICDFNYAVIMGVAGSEPKDKRTILAAAATLKFKGTGTPVQRDLEREKEAAEMEREYKLKRERDKFIDI